MKYKPLIQGYKWITATTSNNGNGGLHDQEAFKSGVAMLEVAIDEWHSPRLVHLILTGATALQYDSFIKRVKRDLAGIKYAYKGCTETASNRGGLHQHYMFVHDADDSTDDPFDDGNDTSVISKATTATQRTAPDFKVTVAQPYSHDTPYIPLTAYTLQNAACWQSYIFKQRSKEPGHKYLSSRSARRTCPADSQQAQRISKSSCHSISGQQKTGVTFTFVGTFGGTFKSSTARSEHPCGLQPVIRFPRQESHWRIGV